MAQHTLRDRIRAFLQPPGPAATDMAASVPGVMASDVMWANSLLSSMLRFTPYNPDELIGRRGFDVYKNMMTDEQVKAVVRFTRNSITARDWYFQLEDDRLSDTERQFRIDLFSHMVRTMRGSFRDSLNIIMKAQWQGFSITEKVFEPVDYQGRPWIGIDRLRGKPFESFFFHTDDFGNLVRIEQRVNGRQQDVDQRKLIHFVWNPDMDEYYGRSELRECYRSFFSKDVLIKLWNLFLERYAGFLTVEQGAESNVIPNSSTWNDLKRIVDNIQVKSGVILPKGVKATLQQLRDSSSFKEALSFHDQGIAKALLVPKLLGISDQGEVGSFSQSITQLSAFFWTSDTDTGRLEECLNEQLFRQLGELNFADGIYPTLKFKPLSDEKKIELAKMWKDLVAAGAVERTDDDEAWLRELIGAPAKPEETDTDTDEAVDPTTALNGGQVQSIVDIVTKVALGEIPKTTAALLINQAFPISIADANALLADVEEGSIKKPEPPVPGVPPGAPAPGGPGGTPDEPPPSGGNEPGEDEEEEEEEIRETIRGRSVSAAAMTRAQRRVQFAVIDKRTTDLVGSNSRRVANAVEEALADVVARIEEQQLGTPGSDIEAIGQLRFTPKALRRIKGMARDALADGWEIGRKHAQQELDQAMGERFTANMQRLEDEAAAFFEAKAFTMAGKLTDDMLGIIRNVLTNGIKGSATTAEIRENIYTAMVRQGFTTMGDAATALGIDEDAMRELAEEVVPLHRLETTIRTNTFEALNESRFSFFTDPSLDGFVQALEYSAIMDERTTRVCQHLDERMYETGSPVWDKYRPPNHFNCRSLLIPVTVRDAFEPSPPPTVAPQEGFK